MALDIDTEANNENLDGLDVEALDIDTEAGSEASNETEEFAVQFGQNIDFVGNADYSTFDGNLVVDYSSIEADIGDRSDTFQTTWTP